MDRLDKELVNRGLVNTRTKAQELITNGHVKVNDKPQLKASFQVNNEDKIEVEDNNILKYVSRGGLKLDKALNVFGYSVKNKVVLDIGSSTGGFTDCCLQNGARKVIGIDVGSNVMHPSLRNNPCVELHENTNIKDVPISLLSEVETVVVDVSFISLERIAEKLNFKNKKLDVICLIKPQFECGKHIASKFKGVIKSKSVHNEVIDKVIAFFNKNNFYVENLDFSPITGGDGNIEYLAYFTNKTIKNKTIAVEKIINKAFKLNN